MIDEIVMWKCMVDWTALVDCMVIDQVVYTCTWVGTIALDGFQFVMAIYSGWYINLDIWSAIIISFI